MNLTVFISTAGTGSRLEHLTKFQNKSLVSVNHKPIISHIIENIPKESNLVVALGHKGDYVKQYLKLVYPQHKIKFIKILKYSGEGSGLGLTLFKSKSKLQKPFLFIKDVDYEVLDTGVNKVFIPKNLEMCWSTKSPCSYKKDLVSVKKFNYYIYYEKN